MINKIKNRNRVLIFSDSSSDVNNIQMSLSSHGYLVDNVSNFEEATKKMINYKPSIFIADVDLLPVTPYSVTQIFNKAKKHPVFLLINRGENKKNTKVYLDYGVDDLLTIPFSADKLYRKVKRAADYNRMQHLIEYHSGMLFMLKLITPIILLTIYLIYQKGL